MASIVQIGERWRAQVRRKGIKPKAQTFDTKQEAEAWAYNYENNVTLLKRRIREDPLTKPAAYNIPGVYVLYRGTQVQYIGRSVHIYRRLYEHSRGTMEWDGFRIWPCTDAVEIALLERKLIESLLPTYNTSMTNSAQKARRRRRVQPDHKPIYAGAPHEAQDR